MTTQFSLRSAPADKVTRIEVYESAALFVLVGHKRATDTISLLQVDRARRDDDNAPPVHEDPGPYTASEAAMQLQRLALGAPLAKVMEAEALLGMIRFLEGYYLLFVTQKEPVGVICGHHVFRVEETSMVSVVGSATAAPTDADRFTVAEVQRRPSMAARGVANEAADLDASVRLRSSASTPGGVRASASARSESTASASAAAAARSPSRADSGSAGLSQPLLNLGRMLQTSAAEVISRLQLAGKWDERWAEKRYKALFMSMDLTRDFYFAHSYDLTNTLQDNMGGHAGTAAVRSSNSGAELRTATADSAPAAATAAAAAAAASNLAGAADTASNSVSGGAAEPPPLRDKFIWNHHLVAGLFQCIGDAAWLTPLVHGFFRQATLSLSGRLLTLTLIARRSRMFAGARLLKRGLCASGHTANEVETEQLLWDGSLGALHDGRICSAVQLRGSVPLFWGHGEQMQIVPRPDIHLQHIDPLYECTLLHFEELWERYGGPVIVFDLVRQAERRAREMLLGSALSEALSTLQRRLERDGHPHRDGLRYVPVDFKKESKRKGVDVLQTIERIASHLVRLTGFFCSSPLSTPRRIGGSGHLPTTGDDRGEYPRHISLTEVEVARRLADKAPHGPVARRSTGKSKPPLGSRALSKSADQGSWPRKGSGGSGVGVGARPMPTRRPTTPRLLMEESTGTLGSLRVAMARASQRHSGGDGVSAEMSEPTSHDGVEADPEEWDDDDDDDDERFPLLQQAFASGGSGSQPTTPRNASSGQLQPLLAGIEHASEPGARRFVQRGIIRTNCIDCLDRTNVAQFCIGRCILKRQLMTLGCVSSAQSLADDSPEVANALLMSMYEEMGTQLALQYAGSQALHATNSNAAKDFLQSVKRFYRNTFTDMEKQHIMDVFLGVYSPADGAPHIWDLDSDLFLHNNPPSRLSCPLPTFATRRPEPPGSDLEGCPSPTESSSAPTGRDPSLFDEYYEPGTLTSFDELLARPFAAPLSTHAKGRRDVAAATPAAPQPSSRRPHPTTSTPGDELLESQVASQQGSASDSSFGWATASWEDYVGFPLGAPSTLADDVTHEHIGDVHVLLPATYMPVDEWEQQRRAEWARSGAGESTYAGLFKQTSDMCIYANYVHSALSWAA